MDHLKYAERDALERMSDALPLPLPARRSRLQLLLRYGVIAVVVMVAGLFIARRQIGDLLARKLDEQLSATGIFLAWQSADWVPVTGIKVHGLALYRDAAKHDRLALLSNATVTKGDPAWNRWTTLSVNVADAGLTLSSGDSETKLEHLGMRLKIEPGKVDLPECHASLQGLRIQAKGEYLHRAAAASASADVATKPASQNKGVFDDADLDWLKSIKEWMAFQPEKDEPVLKVEFHPHQDGGDLDLAATLDGRKFRWRGQKWDFVEASVRTLVADKKSPIEIDHLRIGHAGQTGEIAGMFDPARGVLSIRRFDSGIDVLALARGLVPDAVASFAEVTSKGHWHVSGDGEIPFDHPDNIRWNGRVALDGDLVYATGETRVMLREPALALQVQKRVVSVPVLKAGLWSGTLAMPMMQIHLPSSGTKPRFQTKFMLSGASLQSVISSFGKTQQQPGVVNLDWQGGGGVEMASITGSGALSIQEAEFLHIPLIGSLYVVFDQLTPGFGRDVASSITANYRLAGGTLHVENLILESKEAHIEAHGWVDLDRQYAHLTAKAKLRGIVGLPTALLSALLELEGEGPVADVRWKLNNVPGTRVIGGAAATVGKTGGAVIKGAGNAAKGLLKLPHKP